MGGLEPHQSCQHCQRKAQAQRAGRRGCSSLRVGACAGRACRGSLRGRACCGSLHAQRFCRLDGGGPREAAGVSRGPHFRKGSLAYSLHRAKAWTAAVLGKRRVFREGRAPRARSSTRAAPSIAERALRLGPAGHFEAAWHPARTRRPAPENGRCRRRWTGTQPTEERLYRRTQTAARASGIFLADFKRRARAGPARLPWPPRGLPCRRGGPRIDCRAACDNRQRRREFLNSVGVDMRVPPGCARGGGNARGHDVGGRASGGPAPACRAPPRLPPQGRRPRGRQPLECQDPRPMLGFAGPAAAQTVSQRRP